MPMLLLRLCSKTNQTKMNAKVCGLTGREFPNSQLVRLVYSETYGWCVDAKGDLPGLACGPVNLLSVDMASAVAEDDGSTLSKTHSQALSAEFPYRSMGRAAAHDFLESAKGSPREKIGVAREPMIRCPFFHISTLFGLFTRKF